MLKRLLILVGIIAFTIVNSNLIADARGDEQTRENAMEKADIKLKSDMQRLWIEHAWWTRDVIVSKQDNLEDNEIVLKRLLQNQEDIGNILKPYYGEGTCNKLTELLKEHIVIGGQIIDANRKGDNAAVEKLDQKWRQNADEIVEFLGTINPYWKKDELKEMFYSHLKFTTDVANARKNKNWEEDVKIANLNEEHLIHMGNFLTEGIVKQFPEKFH